MIINNLIKLLKLIKSHRIIPVNWNHHPVALGYPQSNNAGVFTKLLSTIFLNFKRQFSSTMLVFYLLEVSLGLGQNGGNFLAARLKVRDLILLGPSLGAGLRAGARSGP